jgi:hypothetical protein
MIEQLAIARAGRAGIDMMADWAATDGWNPGRADAGCFFAADPKGFWLARVDGAPAACISLVHYDGAFAFLGFYIARPCRDGHKIGPLFADDAATAQRLFRALAAVADGGTVIVDPLDPNNAVTALSGASASRPFSRPRACIAARAPIYRRNEFSTSRVSNWVDPAAPPHRRDRAAEFPHWRETVIIGPGGIPSYCSRCRPCVDGAIPARGRERF